MASSDKHCYTCDGSGKAERGWSGNPSLDGVTCPDCRGTGTDQTPCGTGGDHCTGCGSDWKHGDGQGNPHYEGCAVA